jgi:hypothetical protein
MHAETNKRVIVGIADRISCIRRGHAWEPAQVTLGATSLIRNECGRCGQIGRVHQVEHHLENTAPTTVG